MLIGVSLYRSQKSGSAPAENQEMFNVVNLVGVNGKNLFL